MNEAKQQLIDAVKAAEANLARASDALFAWEAAPENNVYADMASAESAIEDALMDQAAEDCEGAHNCGADSYTREFIVDGVTYIGTLTCEYNRHDKTYYYIESHDFSSAPKA